MKRLWPTLALILLMLGALVPSEALCASGSRQSAHACCRHSSHTPEIKTCCVPRPAQQSTVPQISQMAPAAAHLHDSAPATFVAHLMPLAQAHPIAFPADAVPVPPLVLRT